MLKNKTIMEFPIEHARVTGQKKNMLKQINFVRIKKQTYLSFKLVDANGKMPPE